MSVLILTDHHDLLGEPLPAAGQSAVNYVWRPAKLHLTTDLLTTALTFYWQGQCRDPPFLCYKGEQRLPFQPAGCGYMHTELL